MSASSARPNRRTALRLGGGIIGLAVGIGAGVLDRQASPDEKSQATNFDLGSRPATTTSSRSTTTSIDTSIGLPPIQVGEVTSGVIVIGEAYMRVEPGEADVRTLLTKLPALDGDVVASAKAMIESDFSTGNVVSIDGWIFARSEARAAAVLALTCGNEC